MLFAGSSWAELPISTYKEQEHCNTLLEYEFFIDQGLELDLIVDTEEDFALDITEE